MTPPPGDAGGPARAPPRQALFEFVVDDAAGTARVRVVVDDRPLMDRVAPLEDFEWLLGNALVLLSAAWRLSRAEWVAAVARLAADLDEVLGPDAPGGSSAAGDARDAGDARGGAGAALK